MKDVWKYYNQSFKKKSQTRIILEDEEAKTNFMSYWMNLYKDD